MKQNTEQCPEDCPWRLANVIDPCKVHVHKKRMWSRVQMSYKSVYLLYINNKGTARVYYCRDRRIRKIKCPQLIKGQDHWGRSQRLQENPDKLDRRDLLTDKAIRYILRIGKTKNLQVVKIIDVTKCLSTIEKWQVRKEYKFNDHTNMKHFKWATETLWPKYNEQAQVVYVE
jgi:hypothetical protein